MRAFLLLGLLIPIVLSGCLSPPDIISEEQALFQQQVAGSDEVNHYYLSVENDILHYAAAGDPKKPALIIIHGTPGSWQQYARYLLDDNLREHFYRIVIDRPGWGESTLGNNRRIASFPEQAMVIGELARDLKARNGNQPVILMGHSLGSSVAPRVAMDYPQAIDGLMLFAGSLDPKLGNPRWYNRLGAIPGVGLFVGDGLMNANKEVFALRDNLNGMLPLWEKIQAQTLVVQGMKDELVYPANIDFAERVIPNDKAWIIRLENEGHLFPMTLRQEVADWAICLLDRIETSDKSQCQI